MPDSYLIRGLLIGLVFGVPAGAIGALTIQRTLSYGFVAGLVTGLGASAADLIYAAIGVFGVTIVSDFLLAHQTIISIIGGIIIMGLGIMIFRKNSEVVLTQSNNKELSSFFLTSFIIAITNPATIMAFFIAFSSFGIAEKSTIIQSVELILGILIGTCCWWGFLSGMVTVFRRHVTERIYKRLNQTLGLLMILFGIVMAIKIFYT